jgi:hypothetical protein
VNPSIPVKVGAIAKPSPPGAAQTPFEEGVYAICSDLEEALRVGGPATVSEPPQRRGVEAPVGEVAVVGPTRKGAQYLSGRYYAVLMYNGP